MKNSLRFLLALFMVAAPSLVSAVTINVGDNWQTVVNANPAGTTYSIAPGTHRLQTVTPKTGDQFIGQAGAIMSGATLLTSFTQSGATWFVSGQTQGSSQSGFCEAAFPRCNFATDLFINNVPMQHVASLAEVVPGTFFYDYAADRIYIGDNPAGKTVETSITAVAFSGTASSVTIDSLVVEKYANHAQVGAIQGDAAANWTFKNGEARLNHGVGVRMGPGWLVQNNRINTNGQIGIGCAGCNGATALDNEIAFNNFAHYDAGWEAGGTKWAVTNGLLIKGNYSHDNRGPGLWTDIDNINITYDGNRVENNLFAAGIWHEISCNATIKNNILKGNASGGSVGWLYDSQILISSSSNADVYNNYIEVTGAGNGITMVQQSRGNYAVNCGTGARLTTGNQVHDNSVYYTGTPGISGGAADFNNAGMWAGGNLFNSNAYCRDSVSTQHWAWNDGLLNFAGFQSNGQEASGTAYVPLSNASCVQMLAEDGLPGKRPLVSAQTPYGGTARTIPGTIQVEDYDNGGEGVAYHDTDAPNNGGVYRTDGVDIKTSSDSPASPAVGFTIAGEWAEYTVNVTAAAVYKMDARVASNITGKSFHVEMDGVDVTGAMVVPNTGPFDTAWATITKTGISLTAGTHIMRVFIDSDPLDLNFLTFSSNGPAYWKFNETTGASAADSSGSSTGTLAGSPSWVGGIIDNALSFDGVDDVMTFPGIVVPTTFTFSAWIFPVPSSDNHGALFVNAASDSGIFYNGNTRKISFYYSGADHLSTTAITENLWRHVAVVSTAGAVTFYIDGIANGTATGAPGFTAAYMGSDSTSENFRGVIDDAQYYDSALSATEVRAVYDRVLPVELMQPRALRIR